MLFFLFPIEDSRRLRVEWRDTFLMKYDKRIAPMATLDFRLREKRTQSLEDVVAHVEILDFCRGVEEVHLFVLPSDGDSTSLFSSSSFS